MINRRIATLPSAAARAPLGIVADGREVNAARFRC